MLSQYQNVLVMDHVTATHPTTSAVLGTIDGLWIRGTHVGTDATNLISGTAGVFSFGDPGPQIRFGITDTSTPRGALIFTAHNAGSGVGSSFHFVASTTANGSNETPARVVSDYLNGNTGVTIGQTLTNTSYNLYVNGTSCFTDTIISSNTAAESLVFSRTNGNNYIHAPAGTAGGIAFCISDDNVTLSDAALVIKSDCIQPGKNNTFNIGTSSLKWADVYATTFHGDLDGKLTTARSLKTKLDSTAAVTFDGSADQNAIPVTGTLPIANGGTGQTSAANIFTALSSSTNVLSMTILGVSKTANLVNSIANTWTNGTTAGPTLKTTINGINGTAVAIPVATGTCSGVITTTTQYFSGNKFPYTTDTQWLGATANAFRTLGVNNISFYKDSSWYGDCYVATLGTANSGDNNEIQGTQGITLLRLGNNVARPAAGTAGGDNNAQGEIRIYGSNQYYTSIKAQANGSRQIWLPNYAGAMYLTHAGGNAAVGSASQPVYVAANGRVTAGDSFEDITNYYVWEKSTYTASTATLGTALTNQRVWYNAANAGGSTTQIVTIQYSSSYSINSAGKISLSSPSTYTAINTTNATTATYIKDRLNTLLKNKYVTVYGVRTNAAAGQSVYPTSTDIYSKDVAYHEDEEKFFKVPNANNFTITSVSAYGSIDYEIKATTMQPLVPVPQTKTHNSYVISSASNTYVNGVSGSYIYDALGKVGGGAKVYQGSYIGTGGYTSTNCPTISVPFYPHYIYITDSKAKYAGSLEIITTPTIDKTGTTTTLNNLKAVGLCQSADKTYTVSTVISFNSTSQCWEIKYYYGTLNSSTPGDRISMNALGLEYSWVAI